MISHKESVLILCLFDSVIVVGSPLKSITCLAIGSWTNNGARYGLHLVEWDLNPIRKLLFMPVMVMPLFLLPL